LCSINNTIQNENECASVEAIGEKKRKHN